MNKRCLISGSSGFIGTHLVSTLKQRGYIPVTVSRETLGNQTELYSLVTTINPSYIFHLASYGNHHDQKDEMETMNANVFKSLCLLEALRDVPYSSFINVSSSSVYGVKDAPMKEGDSLDGQSLYAVTKIIFERMANWHADFNNKPIVTVRPFSVYGYGERSDRLIPRLISQIDRPTPMKLSPYSVHDWIEVSDFVDGMIKVMQHAEDLKGKAVNIGMGEQYTNRQIADKIEWIAQKPLSYDETDDIRPYDTHGMWQADNTLIRSLGWKPKFDIMSGLKDTIRQYAKHQAH